MGPVNWTNVSLRPICINTMIIYERFPHNIRCRDGYFISFINTNSYQLLIYVIFSLDRIQSDCLVIHNVSALGGLHQVIYVIFITKENFF